jgi:hypothetical protein
MRQGLGFVPARAVLPGGIARVGEGPIRLAVSERAVTARDRLAACLAIVRSGSDLLPFPPRAQLAPDPALALLAARRSAIEARLDALGGRAEALVILAQEPLQSCDAVLDGRTWLSRRAASLVAFKARSDLARSWLQGLSAPIRAEGRTIEVAPSRSTLALLLPRARLASLADALSGALRQPPDCLEVRRVWLSAPWPVFSFAEPEEIA